MLRGEFMRRSAQKKKLCLVRVEIVDSSVTSAAAQSNVFVGHPIPVALHVLFTHLQETPGTSFRRHLGVRDIPDRKGFSYVLGGHLIYLFSRHLCFRLSGWAKSSGVLFAVTSFLA